MKGRTDSYKDLPSRLSISPNGRLSSSSSEFSSSVSLIEKKSGCSGSRPSSTTSFFYHTRICAVRYDDPIPSHRLLADEVEEGFCGGSMASEVALRPPSSRRHSPSCTFLTENCHSWYGMMSSSESGFRSMAITAPRGTASRYSQ